MKKENIKIKGHTGTWHIIDETEFKGKKVFLLENEAYGDDVACLIVNKKMKIILADVWNGFDDLEDLGWKGRCAMRTLYVEWIDWMNAYAVFDNIWNRRAISYKDSLEDAEIFAQENGYDSTVLIN